MSLVSKLDPLIADNKEFSGRLNLDDHALDYIIQKSCRENCNLGAVINDANKELFELLVTITPLSTDSIHDIITFLPFQIQFLSFNPFTFKLYGNDNYMKLDFIMLIISNFIHFSISLSLTNYLLLILSTIAKAGRYKLGLVSFSD